MWAKYQNLGFDVQQTNKKLVVRAQNITMAAISCTREEGSSEETSQANGNAKLAIVMLLTKMPVERGKSQASCRVMSGALCRNTGGNHGRSK